MSGANVEIDSIKRVRHGLLAISIAFSTGYFEAEKLSKDRIISSIGIGEKLSGAISRTKSMIECKRRDLEIAIKDWRDYEERKKSNPNTPSPYQNPRLIQNQIEELRGLVRKGETIEQEYKTSYKKLVDRIDTFMGEFRKYSSTAGGSGEDVQAVASNLQRMIDNLDRYVRTSFSSIDVASYDIAAQQMNQQYQSFVQDQLRPVRERLLGDDD